jgi:hypothetical protein
MSYDLTIDFAGLCTFVTNGMPESMRVILLRDTSGQAAHAPRLTFDVRDREQFTGSDIAQIVQLPDGRQIASWDLSNKIVALSVDDGSPSNVAYCGPRVPPSDAPRDPLEELNFSWVPSMGRMGGVGNGKAEVAAKYLTNDPGANGPVAARFDTQRGFLCSNAQVNRLTAEGVWTFGGGKQQYLSDTARLEVRGIQAPSIRFTAKMFGGADAGYLELRSPSGSPIAVSLSNLPIELPDAHSHAGFEHFTMYYDLFVPAPAARPVPKSLAGAADPHGGGAHGMVQGIFPMRCTPSQTP